MHIGVVALLVWLAARVSRCLGRMGWNCRSWGASAYEHSLVKANDLSKLDAAFFTNERLYSISFLLFWGAAAALWRVRSFERFEMSKLLLKING